MNGGGAAGTEAAVEGRLPGVASWPAAPAELLAVISILAGATAQLMMKSAMLLWSAHHGSTFFTRELLPPAAEVLCGLAIYAAGTWFWWRAVSRASISYLYPLNAGSYALVALGGRVFFREGIQTGRWIGIAVITLGVVLMTLSNSRGSE